MNGQVEEVYSGHSIIKAFNKEENVIDEFDATNDKLYDSAWKSQFFSGMNDADHAVYRKSWLVVVAILGGFLTIKKTIEVGDIQSFLNMSEVLHTDPSQNRTGCKHAADDSCGVRESV